MRQLRDYQAGMIDQTRQALRRTRKVLLQAPTGAGKTQLAASMAHGTVGRGASVYFICHRAELVFQTGATFSQWEIPHSHIAAGHKYLPDMPAQVCSIDTLKNRVADLPPPRLAIWDECHHLGAAGWQAVMNAWGDSLHVGLSATPWRLDGSGLGDFFGELVPGPQVSWLIEQGYLADYRIFCPPPPADLRAAGADDGRASQARVLNTPKLTGDVVEHWRRHASGLRTVGFACNVEHSRAMVAAFNAAGIPAAHLDGGTKKDERQRIIREFAAGEILALWNVSLFGEGFDLAAIAQADVTIDCVILNRQTNSLSLYLQMCGRALRPAPGKTAIILDHAGNCRIHGYPDDDREWTLEGRTSGEKRQQDSPPPPYIHDAPGCYMGVRRPLPAICPHCGGAIAPEVKKIEVVSGDLEEAVQIAKKQERFQRQQEERECRTLAELVTLGHRRGYPSPQSWAWNRWAVHQNNPRNRKGLRA